MKYLKFERYKQILEDATQLMINQLINNPDPVGNFKPDVSFDMKYRNFELRMSAKIMNAVTPRDFASLLSSAKLMGPDYKETFFLAAVYISKQAKKKLKEDDINYMDLSGDVYISTENLYIKIETPNSSQHLLNKRKHGLNDKERVVIEHFIKKPEDIKLSLRTLEAEIDASRSTISNTIRYMQEQNYIGDDRKVSGFTNFEGMIDEYFSESRNKEKAYDFLNRYSREA